jgi:hypothetical protein
MLRYLLAATFSITALGTAAAADRPISNDPPTAAGCRQARAIVEDRQRHAIDGTFSFVDGDNMVCFRGPQPRRIVLKPTLEHTAPPPRHATPALPQPNLVVRTPPMPQPPSPWQPGSNVAGDGLPVKGTLAFKTGHVMPLTQTREIGTRIGGNLTQDKVSFNSFEVRLAQRF